MYAERVSNISFYESPLRPGFSRHRARHSHLAGAIPAAGSSKNKILKDTQRDGHPSFCVGDRYGTGILETVLQFGSVARLPQRIHEEGTLSVRGLHEARDL